MMRQCKHGFDDRQSINERLLKMNYWHITPVENFVKIINEGLQPNEHGQVFLFDNKNYSADIAINQLFITDYALFKIISLQKEGLKPDNVAEKTAHAQWIYDQAIPSKDIKFIGCYKIRIPA